MPVYATDSIATRFWTKRRQAGYSVEEVAAVLRCSVEDVSRWERGISCPSRESFMVLGRLFNCSPSYLLFDTPHIAASVNPLLPQSLSVENEFASWEATQAVHRTIARYQRRLFVLPATNETTIELQNTSYTHLGVASARYRAVMQASQRLCAEDAAVIARRRPADAQIAGRMCLVLLDGIPPVLSTIATEHRVMDDMDQVITRCWTQFVEKEDRDSFFWMAMNGVMQVWDCRNIRLTRQAQPKRVSGTTNVFQMENAQ
tara:strand:- start:954 stop:1730 length:777 start_codon:yes stop_codon:yes gene_type:complete